MFFVFFIATIFGCTDSSLEQANKALDDHDLALAEKKFREIIQKDPKKIDALIGLGWTYQLAGEKKNAEELFDRCLQLQSGNPDCLRGKASIYLSNNKILVARLLLEEALSKHPDHPGVLSSAALFWLTEGNHAKAEKTYLSLSRRFPNRAEYLLGLGESRLRQGERAKEVVEIAEKALEMPGTAVRYQAMLWALRARALVQASSGLENENKCEETARPVLKWIEAAYDSVKYAEATGVKIPELPVLRRTILRRKAVVLEKCPSVSPVE